MITLQRIKAADSDAYRFMESLITSAFPKEEYRDLAELRLFTVHETAFHNNIILDNNTPMGILTYWDMGDFCYVEHFAIMPGLRNNGYGRQAINHFTMLLDKPVVLEVEMPEDDISTRRIEFYKRQGFVLWDKEYMQPPYCKGYPHLPMRLMAFGSLDADRDFIKVRDLIYNKVYGQTVQHKD